MIKKIIIGTANFNLKYGINDFKFKKKELKFVLFKNLLKKKIDYFDTSFNYNLTNNFLKNFKFENSKIITKFSLPKTKIDTYLKNFEKKIIEQRIIYKISSFEAILFHNVLDLKSMYSEKILKILFELKKKGIVKKIGVSIYSPDDLKVVFSKFNPDIVQAPINIFDQRLLKSKWLKVIKKNKILIQARSIFLQGSLVKDLSRSNRINMNIKMINKIKKFHNWCNKKKISRVEACVIFIKNINFIDHIVVGIDSNKDLNEILKALNKRRKINVEQFSTLNQNLIDPRKWK